MEGYLNEDMLILFFENFSKTLLLTKKLMPSSNPPPWV
jgi:hypothetical protein